MSHNLSLFAEKPPHIEASALDPNYNLVTVAVPEICVNLFVRLTATAETAAALRQAADSLDAIQTKEPNNAPD